MTTPTSYSVLPIGFICPDLKCRDEAPRQGLKGAPDVSLEVSPRFAEGMKDIVVGEEIIVITWLHKAERNTLKVHPRDDISVPLTGVVFDPIFG